MPMLPFKTISKSQALKDKDQILETIKAHVDEGWSFPCAVAKAGINYSTAVYISNKNPEWQIVRKQAVKRNRKMRFE